LSALLRKEFEMKGQTEEKLHQKNDTFFSPIRKREEEEYTEEEEEEREKRRRERGPTVVVVVVVAEMERLKLGPTEMWTGLVLHRADILVYEYSYFMNF
jgi:CO dehydrogenase/acetyl-CoA synthase beta subunit